MNRYVGLLFLCWLLLFAGCTKHSDIRVPVVDKTISQTVGIIEQSDDEWKLGCTAVWINDNTILTARHCINGVRQARFINSLSDKQKEKLFMTEEIPTFEDYELLGTVVHYIVESEYRESANPSRTHDARVIALDEDYDVAVLTAGSDAPSHFSAPIVADAPPTGTEVSIVGHTRGMGWNYMKGTVSRIRPRVSSGDSGGPYVHIVALINKGNSGGGAFDSHGCLIGIASFILNSTPGQAFFIHPKTITKFLDENHVKYAIVR